MNTTLHPVPDSNELETKIVTLDSEGNPKSFIFDSHWDFSDMEPKGVGKNAIVTFTNISTENRRDIQTTVFNYLEHHKAKCKRTPTANVLDNLRYGLSIIAELIGGCNWKLLSQPHTRITFLKSFRRWISQNDIGRGPTTTVLTSIRKLTELGLCNKPVSKDEFDTSNLPREGKQHIAIPMGMYQQILNDAIATVETYHPHRHSISKTMNKALKASNEERAHLKNSGLSQGRINDKCTKVAQSITHKIPNFQVKLDGSVINRLFEQCAIVLLSFIGMRIGELISLTNKSYSVKNGIPVLQGETTKGTRGKPTTTTWQTHHISKLALELAYDMSQYLRAIYKQQITDSSQSTNKKLLREVSSAFICSKPQVAMSGYVSRDISDRLNKQVCFKYLASAEDVIEFERLNPTRHGDLKTNHPLPKLTSHDFRRIFAVFFKRYGFGGVSGIKFQFKHRNINMSDYYANNASLQAMEDILLDNDLLDVFKEEDVAIGIDIFDEIYNESETLSGGGGERIAQDKFNKLKSGHQIYMDRSELEILVRNGSLSVVKLPTGGYCTNTDCSRLCGITEFAAEKKPCDHLVITDKEAKNIQRQTKRLITTFRGMNNLDFLNKSILTGLKQKIQLNEKSLANHGLSFEPFTDDINGQINMETV